MRAVSIAGWPMTHAAISGVHPSHVVASRWCCTLAAASGLLPIARRSSSSSSSVMSLWPHRLATNSGRSWLWFCIHMSAPAANKARTTSVLPSLQAWNSAVRPRVSRSSSHTPAEMRACTRSTSPLMALRCNAVRRKPFRHPAAIGNTRRMLAAANAGTTHTGVRASPQRPEHAARAHEPKVEPSF